MTTQKYLFFNELTQEWEKTTLDELATLDNESALVCPLKEDGTPGAQTTYGALLKAAVPKQTLKKAVEWVPTAPASTPAAPPAPEEKPQLVALSKELENTIFFTCRVFNMFTMVTYYGAALLYCELHRDYAAILLAILVHITVHVAYLGKKVR